MLKQQTEEIEAIPATRISVLPTPVMVEQEAKQALPQAKQIPPLYLSGWHWLLAFGTPLLYGMLLTSLQFLPSTFRYSENGAMLQVVLLLPLPTALCYGTGYLLRTGRIASLSGALMGFALAAAGWLSRWVYQQGLSSRPPFQNTNITWKALLVMMGVGAFIGMIGAAQAQHKYGRRMVYDRDRNC